MALVIGIAERDGYYYLSDLPNRTEGSWNNFYNTVRDSAIWDLLKFRVLTFV